MCQYILEQVLPFCIGNFWSFICSYEFLDKPIQLRLVGILIGFTLNT